MKVITDTTGKVIMSSAGAHKLPENIEVHNGTVDTVGLQELGWDAYDIAWLQQHVWWDANDNAKWAVNATEKSYGPNGATPLTWATRADVKLNREVRFLPKLTPTGTSLSSGLNGYIYLCAIPTHGWNLSSVTNINNLFANGYSLRSVGDIGEWNVGNVTIMSNIFISNYLIKDVGDLSHWNTEKVTTMSYMFYGAYHLEHIGDISGWDVSKVESLSYLFANCYNLHDIGDLSEWDLSSCTSISAMTSACHLLFGEEDFSEWDVSKVTTIQSAFGNAITLEELDLSGWNCALLTGVGTSAATSAFANLHILRRLVLGSKFFAGTATTFYFDQLQSWTRDSIYQSLYTNQTLRSSSSTAITIRLASRAYDSLSAQDLTDIASKNFTLVRV